MIKFCGCTGDRRGNTRSARFQDSKHGIGRRVCNEGKGVNNTKTYKCTVCGFEVKAK